MNRPCKYTVYRTARRYADLFRAFVAAVHIINEIYYGLLTADQRSSLDKDNRLDQDFNCVDGVLHEWE